MKYFEEFIDQCSEMLLPRLRDFNIKIRKISLNIYFYLVESFPMKFVTEEILNDLSTPLTDP